MPSVSKRREEVLAGRTGLASSSDSHTSITRQPPFGLGPAMWKIPPAGFSSPSSARICSYDLL